MKPINVTLNIEEFNKLFPSHAELERENARLREALERVIDSPWEPDKWRLSVEQALGVDGPKTWRESMEGERKNG
jgi:hypothetical protein